MDTVRRTFLRWASTVIFLLITSTVWAATFQTAGVRQISGAVVNQNGELLPAITVIAKSPGFERTTATNENGDFTIEVPTGDVTLRVEGQYIRPLEQVVAASGGEILDLV